MINFLIKLFNIDNPYIYYDIKKDRLVEVWDEDKKEVDKSGSYIHLGKLRE